MNLIPIQPDSKDLPTFESINTEAFPPFERVSFNTLFRLAGEMDTDILGVYEEAEPVGFIIIVKSDSCAYVFFLAIDKAVRSKGYGGRVLREVIQRYTDRQIILDFEELDPKAENYPQRVKRKAFYLRNGFHETGHYTFFPDGQRCEVVCSKGSLDIDSFRNFVHEFHKHWENFPDKLV